MVIKAKAPSGKTGRKPFPTNPKMFERAQIEHADRVFALNEQSKSQPTAMQEIHTSTPTTE